MAITQSVVDGDYVPTTPKPPPVQDASLPPATSSDVSLVQANSLEYAQSSRLNGEEWRGPLTIDQYMEREAYLLSQSLTKEGGATCWILTSSDLPLNADGSRPVLASCETMAVHAYVARNGKLDKIIGHGIGSVFTRAEHRGKGYAGRMMTELGKKLATWQQPNGSKGILSVLYSDIGMKFYSRFGWRPFPSTHIHLAPMKQSLYKENKEHLPEVEDLFAKDLQDLPAARIVEAELISQSEEQPDVAFVAIRPDQAHFEWHHAREDFVSDQLGLPVPEVKGAIHRPTGVAVVWARVFAKQQQGWQLHILHIVLPRDVKTSTEGMRALSALLLRAQHEADQWNMLGGVEIWDPSELTVAAAQSLRIDVHDKVEIVSRDQDHVCSLRWMGTENSVDEVVWKYNQKYAWC